MLLVALSHLKSGQPFLRVCPFPAPRLSLCSLKPRFLHSGLRGPARCPHLRLLLLSARVWSLSQLQGSRKLTSSARFLPLVPRFILSAHRFQPVYERLVLGFWPFFTGTTPD
jgi:hypothetical protein